MAGDSWYEDFAMARDGNIPFNVTSFSFPIRNKRERGNYRLVLMSALFYGWTEQTQHYEHRQHKSGWACVQYAGSAHRLSPLILM